MDLSVQLPDELLAHNQQLARDNPKDLVAIYNMDETCVWASPSHQDILGYTPEEMVGHHWRDMVAPEDHAHAALAGSDALLNGRSIEFGLHAATKTGERVALRGQAWISFDQEAGVGYLVFHAKPA